MALLTECSWDQARELCESNFASCGSETIAIVKSANRYLASDIKSLTDLPAYDTSSMDGWAVSGSGPWSVIGEVKTGFISDLSLAPNQCLKISTGGVVPPGATAILPWENAKQNGELISGQVKDNDFIRPAGAEAKSGEIILEKGTKITPPMIGLLAGCGHDEIEVNKKPKIAVFYLGDELLHSGLPKAGAVRDALGCQLPSLIESYGAQVISNQFLKDDLETLINSVSGAMQEADLIITTGGTADGPRDFIKPTIENFSGEYLIDRVLVRPGYHILLAKLSGKIPLLALPGNPQSAIAALTAFGEPLIGAMTGRLKLNIRQVPLAAGLSTQQNHWRMVPGNLVDGKFEVAQFLGSNMLRGLAYSQGFALLEPGSHNENELVRWLPLSN
jgi:molybdopterin molybdotransferase